MPVFKGNTSTNATSSAYDIPYKITYFNITNKSGGSITLNIGILYGSTISITPYNLTLDAGDTPYLTSPILVLAGHQIYITTTGNIDYYFSLE